MEKKPRQLLIIDPPNELKFVGPFNKPSVTNIRLTNPTDTTQLFKIKTTAPRKYCVRPNFGAVQPNNTTVIDICLQPFTLEQNERNKHKFMVQSFGVPEGSSMDDFDKLWKEIDPYMLADTKLKCVFEFPAGTEAKYPDNRAIDLDDSKESDKDVKVSPVPVMPATAPIKKEESKIEKSDSELRKMKEDFTAVRQENAKLQEQILRLKLDEAKTAFTPQTTQQEFSVTHILLSIITMILGIVMGKYLL